MNKNELKKVITEFIEKYPIYNKRETEQTFPHPFPIYKCNISFSMTDFCYINFFIIQEGDKDSEVRVLVSVSSRDKFWRAFQAFSSEWRVKELTVEKLETCLRNYKQIIHNIRCEEQRIHKSFKVSIKKNKIFKDSLEEVV